MKRLLLTGYVCFVFMAGTASAGETLKEAFLEGKPTVDIRYRYEHVNQDGLFAEANASTLRTRLGYESGMFKNFMTVVEFENITQIGSDDYNDTLNGKTDHPVVADVESTELNQAYGKYTGIDDTALKIGRQVITMDDHRFIGHVGWRQNNQTFDAFTLSNSSIPDTVVQYGHIWRVNRIFGDDSPVGDFDSESNYFNIANESLPIGEVIVFGYLFDFKDDSPANSSQTYGVSLSGKTDVDDGLTFKYLGVWAHQSDYGDNTTDYGANYWHVAPALVWEGITTTVGYEVLGSDDGAFAVRTPLATGHKFNGWADVFLTTPATGLEDFYVDLAYKVAGLEGSFGCMNGLLAKFQYHDFSPEEGGGDYGTEYGVYLKQPIKDNMYVEVKYADYHADGFATDREKVTVSLGFKY